VLTQACVDSIFREINQSLSIYDSNSLISRFNRSREGIAADSHLLRMVRRAKEFSVRSDGAFDITLKTVSGLWGFGPGARTGAPTEAEIRKAMKHAGMNLLGITGNYIRKKDDQVQIDCNGIAQGYTVDIIADFLEQRGVRDYLVELGGEIRLSGVNAEGSPWTIGIESPPEGNRPFELARTIRPGSGAITSSGVYRNQHPSGGRQVSHLIDPETGYPISNGMVSVTVWSKDATTADAIDNILMVIGPAEIRHFLDAYPGVEAYWQFRLPDGKLVYAASPGFIRMMDQAGKFPKP
jgi:thiamine biosynthesis lipoprotein